jgi:hypothetical protein
LRMRLKRLTLLRTCITSCVRLILLFPMLKTLDQSWAVVMPGLWMYVSLRHLQISMSNALVQPHRSKPRHHHRLPPSDASLPPPHCTSRLRRIKQGQSQPQSKARYCRRKQLMPRLGTSNDWLQGLQEPLQPYVRLPSQFFRRRDCNGGLGRRQAIRTKHNRAF